MSMKVADNSIDNPVEKWRKLKKKSINKTKTNKKSVAAANRMALTRLGAGALDHYIHVLARRVIQES